MNKGIVNIQGKSYVTVARRVELAHEGKALESVVTEVLNHQPVVVKATVRIKGQHFTGISSVNPESGKTIERQNPYEVAETSAVGRALGFAGYGLLESIASADEVVRAVTKQSPITDTRKELTAGTSSSVNLIGDVTCKVCGKPATEKQGKTKGGKAYHGIFCSSEDRRHTQWLWN